MWQTTVVATVLYIIKQKILWPALLVKHNVNPTQATVMHETGNTQCTFVNDGDDKGIVCLSLDFCLEMYYFVFAEQDVLIHSVYNEG